MEDLHFTEDSNQTVSVNTIMKRQLQLLLNNTAETPQINYKIFESLQSDYYVQTLIESYCEEKFNQQNDNNHSILYHDQYFNFICTILEYLSIFPIIFRVIIYCMFLMSEFMERFAAQNIETKSSNEMNEKILTYDNWKHKKRKALRNSDSIYHCNNECLGNLSQCWHLQNMHKLINSHKSDISHIFINNHAVKSCLDSFLHLLSKHSSNEQYESIYNALGGFCDMQECRIFKRHYRDRSRDVLESVIFEDLIEEIANQQILDKIHCYFSHCYDIGYRITVEQRNAIRESKSKLTQISKILSNKKYHILVNRKRVNKFVTNLNGEEQFNAIYSYGYRFVYHTSNLQKIEELYLQDNVHLIHEKYQSFKQEITNKTSYITIDQFLVTLTKAKKHYGSGYCRDHLKGSGNLLSMHHLLAVMIYCNFDLLQNKFSETYRKIEPHEPPSSVIDRHSEFYWLGKYLKEAVNEHGSRIGDQNVVTNFYRGINQHMVFPELSVSEGVRIHAPLSTSSAFEVAANFSSQKGLIIEFQMENSRWERLWTKCTSKSCGYFSCDWLSMYGNEKECLFIQNNYRLRFNNIVNTVHNVEYSSILNAMRCIDMVMAGNINLNTYKYFTVVSSLMQNQLQSLNPNYAPILSLDSYEEKLFNVYCDNKKEISINYKFNQQYHWMSAQNLSRIFANIEILHVYNFDLKKLSIFLDEILDYVYINASNLESVNIYCTASNVLRTRFENTIRKYKERFESICFCICIKYGVKLIPTIHLSLMDSLSDKIHSDSKSESKYYFQDY
eukprot:394209_1